MRTSSHPTRPGCLDDPISVHGLRGLARERPDWDVLVRRTFPVSGGLAANATIPEILRSGIVRRLNARGPGDLNRVYADRGAAIRLAAAFSDVQGREITESEIRRFMDAPPEQGGGGSTRARDASLLRHVLQRFREETGAGAGVLPRACPAPGRKTPPPLAPQHREVVAVLEAAVWLTRLLMCLTLGAGAKPRELAVLLRGDLVLCRGHGALVLLGVGERKRAIPLPGWVFDVMTTARWGWGRRPDRSVFGADATPDVLRRRLATAVRSAGLEPGRVTLTRLYSTYQALLAPHGACRAAVRGRWALPVELRRRPPTSWPERVHALAAPMFDLAEHWSVLSAPPGGWPERVLPRPSGRVRPEQPERRRAPAPLPPSVR